ncbi:MAG: hypothetical protein M5U34_25825 [Chloroflexi bacterium]|nr:hypothetical protein [Chloroflexota bacterium]
MACWKKGAEAVMGGVLELSQAFNKETDPETFADSKPFFIGCEKRTDGEPLPPFSWQEPSRSAYAAHQFI